MRNHFAQEVTTLAGENEKLLLLSGDIGNRLFNNYKEKYDKRFINCGVAEANMASVAAGAAMAGMRPITYTITAFNTLRCIEQIRVDICYQNLPVVMVGVGGGLSYAALNATHHALEDIAMMRSLPNMTVVCPGDAWEVRSALRAALQHPGPVYIRLGKKNEPQIHSEPPPLTLGKAIRIKPGKQICFLNTGTLLPHCLEVADRLEKEGVSAEVWSYHTVKPLDEECLQEVFQKFDLVVSVEEHSVLGGFGGSIAEWLCEKPAFPARFLRVGTRDEFMYEAGEQEHARQFFGVDSESIYTQVLQTWKETQS